jgi:phage terminase large subunit GpA-like protein
MTAPFVDSAASVGHLRAIAAATARRLCVVPEPLTVTEWAERERVLPETSTSPGAYRPDVTPYARRPQDLLADPATERVVLCWASQTTKSTCLENAIAYRICRQPTPIVVVQPKIDAAEAWAKERLVPMIAATPALRERVRLGRSTDSTLRYKRFPGGFVYVASAQSATELASRSAPFVLVDECDRMEMLSEGSPVEIVARRQGAADVGTLVLTSTPRNADDTVIWPYLEGGTFELYHVPCPHCGTMQPLVWANLRWESGKPQSAHYTCVEGCVVDEADKPAMLAAGEWVATRPENPYASFHLNALYSPFAKSSWATLAEEWERAQGKPADLQVFVNTRLAELWTIASEATASDTVAELVEPLEEGVVPAGVGVLTAGVDVQQNRLECYVWGWGAGLESWLVASAVFPGDPAREPDQPGSVWRDLDAYLAQTFKHESGAEVPIRAAFVDSGYATSAVYRFTKRRAVRRVFAIKGVGGEGRPILGKPSAQTKERVVLFPIGVDTAKTEFLRSQVMERTHGPGYVHLPEWLTPEQLEQLVSEKRIRRVVRGQPSYEWRPKKDGQATEALDCRLYARAALESLGAPTVAGLATLSERLSSAPAQAPASPPQSVVTVRPRRPGTSFVNGWRTSVGQKW